MDPLWRNRLVAVGASVMAVLVGAQLAYGQHLWAFALLGLAVVIGLEWLGGPRPEALALGGVIVGYLLGNRGFAQLSPFGNAPLFFGELALATGLGFMAIRGAIARRLPFRPDLLNAAVLVWIAVGCLRIWWDVKTHGGAALRDFATIYYAGYFFAAQALMSHRRSADFLRGCMTFAAVTLPLVSAAYSLFPDFFLNTLTFRGVPLIYQKNDLAATFLYACGFYLLSASTRGWTLLAALACLLTGLAWLSRAGMLALLAMSAAWAWARRWRPLALLGATAAIGLLVITADAALGRERFVDTRAYAIYEHLVSVLDVSGTRTYRNADSADSGDNNRFRLVWWRSVVDETLRTNPWLGLGFGHDLARGFLLNYGMRADDSFSARSPHSIFFTMLGRLGAVGVLALLLLTTAMSLGLREVLLELRRARGPSLLLLRLLGWWSGAWVIFIAAWLGVVLEGPMGAVVFWILLGVAHAELSNWREARAGSDPAAASAPPPTPAVPAAEDVFRLSNAPLT